MQPKPSRLMEVVGIADSPARFADRPCPLAPTLCDRVDIKPMMDNKIDSIRRPYK
jgi:hypothetical protein